MARDCFDVLADDTLFRQWATGNYNDPDDPEGATAARVQIAQIGNSFLNNLPPEVPGPGGRADG